MISPITAESKHGSLIAGSQDCPYIDVGIRQRCICSCLNAALRVDPTNKQSRASSTTKEVSANYSSKENLHSTPKSSKMYCLYRCL